MTPPLTPAALAAMCEKVLSKEKDLWLPSIEGARARDAMIKHAPALARALQSTLEELRKQDEALLRVPSILAPCLGIEVAQEAARARTEQRDKGEG